MIHLKEIVVRAQNFVSSNQCHGTKKLCREKIFAKESTELTSKYRKLRNKVVKLLCNAKKSYLNNLDVRDKRKFWKTVKFLNKQQSSIPPLHHQGTTANSDHEKATMLNGFFSTCFNRTVPPLVPPN